MEDELSRPAGQAGRRRCGPAATGGAAWCCGRRGGVRWHCGPAATGGVGVALRACCGRLGKFPAPGSLPGRYIGSVSATEVEQSEDYTCIIAHGPNPKTTRIFGDCILELITVFVPDGDSMVAMEVKEATESYWLVKCSGEKFSDSCLSCKEKLDGNNTYICRGDKTAGIKRSLLKKKRRTTLHSAVQNCRYQEILVEEEVENNTLISSFSSFGSSSSFNDDIFMARMVVLTGPIDAQLP